MLLERCNDRKANGRCRNVTGASAEVATIVELQSVRVSSRFGPGLLVAAAFIGPGTVTTATKAGAGYGYALLWVLLFSIVATIVLQEMSARLGLATRAGLGEALRSAFLQPLQRTLAILLIVAAIALGNAAYQTGNIAGASMALTALTGVSASTWSIGVGLVAGLLLWSGSYRAVERILIALVALMSLVFVTTAVMTRPDAATLLEGLFTPTLPHGSLTIAIALIGTTVVPYNLFLHASAASQKWPASMDTGRAIRDARFDTVIAVTLGGVVTLAIVVTAAAFFREGASVDSAAAMAAQLEPLLGGFAPLFFSLGLLAAGVTSAITAPLAAAYATGGAFGWRRDLRSARFRAVWAVVLVTGTIFAANVGESPVAAIILAQAANGLILPVVALFLLYVVNQRRLIGEYANGALANVLGTVVVLTVSGLGLYRLVLAVWKLWG